MLNSEEIVGLFGVALGDSRIDQVFAALNTLNRPRANREGDSLFDWVLVRRKGVELGFSDSCYSRAEQRDRWGRGEWLLTQAYFYFGFDGVQRFQGELPYALTFSDNPAIARERLSQFEATRHSYLTDTWDVEGYRLTVKYDANRQCIDRIACRLLPAPLKTSASSDLPFLQAVISSLGESIQSKPVLADWRVDLSEEQISEAIDDRLLDLGASIGAEFSLAGGQIRSITLHRDRDADAAQWAGELPCGLTFDDSPEDLLLKVNAKPVQHLNSELTGHAVWHFEDYTLHVLYSHVDNRILRVTLIAPGTWKCIEDD